MVRRYLRELNAQVYKVVAQVGTRFLSVYHLALLQIADLCRQTQKGATRFFRGSQMRQNPARGHWSLLSCWDLNPLKVYDGRTEYALGPPDGELRNLRQPRRSAGEFTETRTEAAGFRLGCEKGIQVM